MPDLTAFGPLDLVAAAFSTPLFSLLLAGLLAAGILIILTRPREDAVPTEQSDDVRRSLRRRYLPERRTLSIAALAVIVLFVGEHVLSGYVLDLFDAVAWWRYAAPLLVAALGLGVLLALVLTRGTAPSEAPVPPVARRTWRSFGPRWGIVGAGILALVLLATTVTAGLASSPNSRGWYVWLEIPIANEPGVDPLRPWFYGWTYGVPVLLCLAALVAVAWAALHANAARPYLRPEAVVAEREGRRGVASGIVGVASAGMLLALAGAWRLIAGAGTITDVVIEGQNGGAYEATWRYAELAMLLGWLAPLLEIAAFVVLLLVVAGVPRSVQSGAPAVRPLGVEALR